MQTRESKRITPTPLPIVGELYRFHAVTAEVIGVTYLRTTGHVHVFYRYAGRTAEYQIGEAHSMPADRFATTFAGEFITPPALQAVA